MAGFRIWAGAALGAAVIFAAPAAGFAVSGGGQAVLQKNAAGKPGTQRMVYEVYAGGINAVTAELDVSYGAKDRYRLELSARTKGFLATLAPWRGSFETEGWRLKDGKDLPETHKSVAVWRDEEEVKEYAYGRDGSFKGLKVVNEGRDESPETLDEDLTRGTTDVLSATLAVMKGVAGSGACSSTSEVFDGDRRFRLVFGHEAEEALEATDYNVYNGTAVRCEVEVAPVSGKWHTKPRGWLSIQEQGRQQGSLPTVWFAKIDENAPAVPVKVRVKTDYGTLYAHLVEYQEGDRVIEASTR